VNGYTLTELRQTLKNEGTSLTLITEGGALDLLELRFPLDCHPVTVTTEPLMVASNVATEQPADIAALASSTPSD
jgi:hypothetical protein